MAERHAEILGELAELGLSLARKLHGEAMAAETPEETALLSREFHRLSRSVRQTLALEAKMQRDAEGCARDEVRRAEAEHRDRVLAHKQRIRAPVCRLIWNEAEDQGEAEDRDDAFEDLLAEAALAPDFLETPVETHIARLKAALPLPDPPPQGEAAAQPTEGVEAPNAQAFNPLSPFGAAPPEGEHLDWRSSA